MPSMQRSKSSPFILDVGGEGRHARAWNLNPRACKSLGVERGDPIPNLIRGRGERIPLPDRSVEVVIVERTPLRVATLNEIQRVAKPGGLVVLRHAPLPWSDPHRLATRLLPGRVTRSMSRIGRHVVCQTTIRVTASPTALEIK